MAIIRRTRKVYRKRNYRRPVAKKIRRYVKRTIEHQKNWKVNDFYCNNVSLSTGGQIFDMTTIQRIATNVGSNGEEASRTSNRIRVEKLSWRFRVIAGSTTTAVPSDIYNQVRLTLLKSTIPYSSYAGNTYASYFMGGTSAVVTSPKRPYDREYKFLRDRMKIVYDRAAGGGQTINGVTSAVFTGTIRFKRPHYVYYNSDVSTSATKGGLYFIAGSDSTIAPNPFIDGYARLWYTDA